MFFYIFMLNAVSSLRILRERVLEIPYNNGNKHKNTGAQSDFRKSCVTNIPQGECCILHIE
jgi:hypothetical protein